MKVKVNLVEPRRAWRLEWEEGEVGAVQTMDKLAAVEGVAGLEVGAALIEAVAVLCWDCRRELAGAVAERARRQG